MPARPDPAAAPSAGVIRVTAVVLRDGDDVALVRKAGTRTWIFPGGKPEPGESARETGARELAEELGLSVAPAGLIGRGRYETGAANEPGFHLVADVVLVPGGLAGLGSTRTDVRPAAEIAALLWHPLSEDRADLAPLTALVLRDLRQG